MVRDKFVFRDDAPVVEFRGVHKRFGDQVVLDGIDLRVNPSETLVVIGESGAGKSVILKHMVRLLAPEKGEVHFRGVRIDRLPERKLPPIRMQFGFLFQLSALFDSMTVGQNIAFPLMEKSRLPARQVRDRVAEKLEMVGLEGIEDRMPAELSGGQKKRVALARAIALDARIILYDEPTTGLDPPRSDVINELILKLKRELDVAGVVVTHDMASARKVADRVVMIHEGKMIFEGTPAQLDTTRDERVRCFVEGRCSSADYRRLQRRDNR